jgi:predicted O-methyltransferase YrrM
MNTLTAEPLKSLLKQLFSDAEASSAQMRKDRESATSPDAAMRAAAQDYRAFYMGAKNYHLAVSPDTGALLYMLARNAGARRIVEFGTSFGVSTLHLAAALKDNGGGQLITSEFEPSKILRAKTNFRTAGLDHLIEVREGDALETFANDLPDDIDLILLDGAKSLYLPILRILESRMKPGALIVADNADWAPDYLARVRSVEAGYLSVPFAADVEVSMKF